MVLAHVLITGLGRRSAEHGAGASYADVKALLREALKEVSA